MTANGVPAWVRKRDGRLVPFEADKISQSLFAATEDLGRANAFLAREMTDGVLHFVAQDLGEGEATTTQIVEVVAKVVRELGQPDLAHAYERRHQRPPEEVVQKTPSEVLCRFPLHATPDAIVRGALQTYSLQAVYSRDLAAAAEEGLLVLGGLEHPDDFAAVVIDLDVSSFSPWEQAWKGTRDACAATVVFDSPEYALSSDRAGEWLRGLATACDALGRRAVIHLHTATAPPSAGVGGMTLGPLFGEVGVKSGEHLERARGELAEGWRTLDAGRSLVVLRPHFHQGMVEAVKLYPAAALWMLDRPRQEPSLGSGLDRQHRAILLEAGLSLPNLLARPDVGGDPQLLLAKLPSLARMGVRAGVQKRKHLRRRAADRPGLSRGFLLDRARLALIPLGLDAVVTTLLGQCLRDSPVSREFAAEIVKSLAETAAAESRSTGLDIVLGAPQWPEHWNGPGTPFDGRLAIRTPIASETLRQAAEWSAVVPGGLVELTADDAVAAALQQLLKTEVTRVQVR